MAAEHSAVIATSVLLKLLPADGLRRTVDLLSLTEFASVGYEKAQLSMLCTDYMDDRGGMIS